MSKGKTYRVADIGSGTHGLLAMLNPKLDTTAFCSISEKHREDAAKIGRRLKDKMRKVKEPTPISVYTDYREMIEKEKPDMVTIMTPDPLHAEMSIFALEHGAHVFVEKPMCLTMDEVEGMVEAVKRTGLKLAVNQCRRTIQGYQLLFDMRDRGELGTPYYIRAEYLHGSVLGKDKKCNKWRLDVVPVSFSGGSHPVDFILGFMNDQAETVWAAGSNRMSPDSLLCDMESILMRFPGGRIGYCMTTHCNHRRCGAPSFDIYATGQDVTPTITYHPGAEKPGLRFYDKTGKAGARSIYADTMSCGYSKTQLEIELGHGQGFYRQQENLLYAIEHDVKQRTMADVIDGARSISTILAAQESLSTGTAVKVRQWEPLAYKGTAPLWDLDDYQKDLLREFVPLLSGESRKEILGAEDGLDRTREER